MTRTFPATADVVIVGSGPSGATYARILSELAPEASVVCFEVGPLLASPPGLHVKNIADAEERTAAQRRSEGPQTLDRTAVGSRTVRPGTFLLPSGYQQPGEDGLPGAAMSSNVGGMGAHWTGACPRPGGRERIGFLPNLDDLLDEAERLLHVVADAFDDAPYSQEVQHRLSMSLDNGRDAGRRVQSMPLAVVREDNGCVTWSGSDVIFGEQSRTNANFSLYPEALVERILVDDGCARGVLVKDLRNGTEHEIRAGKVVVAADALRTPQLLWASGVRPAVLGRYLNDQPQTVFAVRLREVAALPEESPQSASGPAISKHSGVSWVPYTDEEPFHGQVMQLDTSPVPLADDAVAAPGSIVGLGWFCAKDLQEHDRVEFDADERDVYGMPAMRIHYSLTGKDHASIEESRKAIRRAAEALGEPLDEEPRTFDPGASLHYQGTTRMGQHDDGTSVCGPNSEVWAVKDLYVAGNGVIPTAIACNPTLLTVALAVAGARSIADQLNTDRN